MVVGDAALGVPIFQFLSPKRDAEGGVPYIVLCNIGEIDYCESY